MKANDSVIAIATLALLTALNSAGVSWVIRLQLILLAFLGLAVCDFTLGALFTSDEEHGVYRISTSRLRQNAHPQYDPVNCTSVGIQRSIPEQSFFTVFGVFFANFLGVLAGMLDGLLSVNEVFRSEHEWSMVVMVDMAIQMHVCPILRTADHVLLYHNPLNGIRIGGTSKPFQHLLPSRQTQIVDQTFKLTPAWKVRVTILNVIQALVFGNIYVCERNTRAQQMSDIIFAGLVDDQSEVRQESARCLQALTHIDFIKRDDALVQRVEALGGQWGRRYAHGTVLGLGAIAQAHPYTLPRQVLPCLQYLCRVSSRYADLHAAATTALREFRRSHPDEWTKTREIRSSTVSRTPSLPTTMPRRRRITVNNKT